MRLVSLTAAAFGPLHNQTLDLSPGLNVVHGPNESGKSSWHAALYLGLCGFRRGKGKQNQIEKQFSSQHRPWDREGWAVDLLLELEDGRMLEIHRDLDRSMQTSARDAALGRDLGGEVLHDGSPDGSKWLGMDRQSFLATACVRQGDVLRVMEQSDLLRDALQQAVEPSSGGSLASAFQLIESFHRERVGSSSARSQRPLRRSQERVERVREELEQARRSHGEYLELVAQAEQLRRVPSTRVSEELPVEDRGVSEEGQLPADNDHDEIDWSGTLRRILSHVGVGGLAAFGGSNLLGGEYHGHGLALVVIGFVIMIRGLGALLVEPDDSDDDSRNAREADEDFSEPVDAEDEVSEDPVESESPELAHLRGRIVERAASLPSVAELEEERRDAACELERLEVLDETLCLTREFLERAEDGVHRNIAPLVARRAAANLERVTAGRYRELRLDPATLAVQVRGGSGIWRDASRLSRGTREQIYLLLRVSLVDQLTAADEICPLILDDVTVHLDRDRKREVLETLRELARDRQVILFSQEEEVREWAECELVDEKDQLVVLEGSSIA